MWRDERDRKRVVEGNRGRIRGTEGRWIVVAGNAKLCMRGRQGGRRQYRCLYGGWGGQDDKSS